MRTPKAGAFRFCCSHQRFPCLVTPAQVDPRAGYTLSWAEERVPSTETGIQRQNITSLIIQNPLALKISTLEYRSGTNLPNTAWVPRAPQSCLLRQREGE